MAAGTRRAPCRTAAAHRRPGRHRAGFRRTAAAPSARPPPACTTCSNLFQVNVEEGRHLWAMVYLLQRLLRPGRTRGGRESAAAQLGSEDAPRILGAFNEPTPDWLAFFMFTYFTDRDGSTSSARSRRARSTRWPAPATSCSKKKRTT
ncbi:hypothetical protein ACU686_31090 [Yinghuangia aomiensis]